MNSHKVVLPESKGRKINSGRFKYSSRLVNFCLVKHILVFLSGCKYTDTISFQPNFQTKKSKVFLPLSNIWLKNNTLDLKINRNFFLQTSQAGRKSWKRLVQIMDGSGFTLVSEPSQWLNTPNPLEGGSSATGLIITRIWGGLWAWKRSLSK